MKEAAFDVLDELYFVTSYQDLKSELDYDEEVVKNTLVDLTNKGWALVYKTIDEEASSYDLDLNFKAYYYLASKKGLMAHHTQ